MTPPRHREPSIELAGSLRLRFAQHTPATGKHFVLDPYGFFTDLRNQNLMDATPFLEFNILRVTEREADLLRPFTMESFNSALIQRHAEEIISLEKVTSSHDRERSQGPSTRQDRATDAE